VEVGALAVGLVVAATLQIIHDKSDKF